MPELEINVTDKHIEKGRRSECRWCPVALAVLDALSETLPDNPLHGFSSVWAYPATTYIGTYEHYADETYCGPNPIEVQNFIVDFDKGKPVKPFSATLKLRLLRV